MTSPPESTADINGTRDISFFHGASGTNTGNIVNIVHVNQRIGASTLVPDIITHTLAAYIRQYAMFNGDIRKDAPRCHPQTRKTITADIFAWAIDLLASTYVLWLTGSVGTGKSAIAHRVAQLLHERDPRLLAGTFFFWRGDPSRNHLGTFVPTLAYQLAIALPEAAIYSQGCSREYQWNALILEPLQMAALPATNYRSVFIIDGLDECGTAEDQQFVLQLIGSFPFANIPVAFIVASRPESHIKDEIDALLNGASGHIFRVPHIVLIETSESREDMVLILTSAFSEIYSKKKYLIGKNKWPPYGAISTIVDTANGQFIYPLTIIRWIQAKQTDPVSRLNTILSENGNRANALSLLDTLYFQILTNAIQPNAEWASPSLQLKMLYPINFGFGFHLFLIGFVRGSNKAAA
ncbi:hypothetical protein AX16_000792 [Volvariella volvacea WC 439]|nr:hypothetical protein AX16_000792 [Volvariella volvacea WC 439]